MLPEESKPKIDFSQASEDPTSIQSNCQLEKPEVKETLPDDYLPKTGEDENNSPEQAKNIVDDQMIIANLHGG